VKSTYWN